MGLQPNIARKRTFAIKQCNRCGGALSPDAFAPTKSIFYADGALPICNSCIADYLEASSLNKIELNNGDIGVITSGASYLYAKEVFGDTVSYLKLGAVNPLPSKLLKDFASKFDKVIVIEELDTIIEDFCKSLGITCEGKNLLTNIGEFSQELLAEKPQEWSWLYAYFVSSEQTEELKKYSEYIFWKRSLLYVL